MNLKDELMRKLAQNIANAEKTGTANVEIPLDDAKRLIEMLSGVRPQASGNGMPGQQLFYCLHCQTSFWADGADDEQAKAKYGYHRWTAVCPRCKEIAVLNDHYWR